MIDTTFDIFNFQTVPSTYSWDKGTPNLPTGFNDLVRDLSACRAVSTANEEGVEYVGYAPFVFLSLSSEPGTISDSFLALKRTVNFGDYYNSETNIDTRTTVLSYESFCHVYVMPGLYTITYERTEYIQSQIEKFNGFGSCLQKHCIDWSFKSLSGCDEANPGVTWASTKTGQPYEKKWKFEPCEEQWANNNGLYVQSIGKEPRLPLSWQWFNFLKNSPNPRNADIPWLSAGFQGKEQLTWRETSGPCLDLKETESVTWRWDLISCNTGTFAKKITWDETKSDSPNSVTWDLVRDNCYGTAFPILSSNTKTIVKKAFVRVLEIPPTAYLTVVEQPTARTTPLTVRLSPRNTITGSFPIERIVWDLGDGSPLLTQRRWSNALEEPFVYSGALDQDYQDPRNYDIIYTYTRSLTSAACFYPSITAYASSTNTSDNAAVIVGPITYANTDGSQLTLLQNELTDFGKVLLGQITTKAGNSLTHNVSLWRAETKIAELITLKYPYRFLDYNTFLEPLSSQTPKAEYYTFDQVLIPNFSKIYYTKYSNSKPVSLLSGISDVDKDENVDFWQTDINGTINWQMIVVHPYEHLTYYANDAQLINNQTVLYGGQGTGAATISDLSGSEVDLDGDGNEDTWKTNNLGVISWTISIVHPYANLGYYTNTPDLIKGSTVLYSGQYSSSPFVPGLTGTEDLDGDGNLDRWNTNNQGVINWSMIIVHPYQRLGYYSDDQILIKNSSVIWTGAGTGAVPLVSANGGGFDADDDGNNDTWFTNGQGIVSWTMTIVYPYLHFGYYSADQNLITGVSRIYGGRGSGAEPIGNQSGVNEIKGDGDDYNWYTDFGGRITFTEIIVHPYAHIGYFANDPTLIKNYSTLFTRRGTGGIPVVSLSGIADADKDGNDDLWITDSSGVVTWDMVIVHPYSHINYYSNEETLIKGFSKFWSGQGTGATLITNSTGRADVDGDGNDDNWTASSVGILTWTMVSAHPYFHFGYYSNDQFLFQNVSILWNGQGTGAALVANLSGDFDIDKDGNDDRWTTNNDGRVAWAMISAYPYFHFGYYSLEESLINNTSVLRNKQGTGATVVSGAQGIVDADNDGNDDSWSTNNLGVITWAMISAHPYYQFDSYYSDVAVLANNSTSILWTDQGTKGIPAINLTGVVDIDKDGNNDQWQTNYLGAVSWYMITAYPFRHFTSYFAVDQTLVNNSSILHNSQGTGALSAVNISGDSIDIDLDGNLDSWQTNQFGVISWSPTIYHPYSHLTYFSDDEILISGASVLWNTEYSGAVTVNNASGTNDLNNDGNLKNWSTNNLGTVSWTLVIVHPYQNLGYFTNEPNLENGVTVLFNTRFTGATVVSGVSSTFDIDQDGNLEAWQTDNFGVVSWYTIAAYPYYQLGYYSADQPLINNVSELRSGTGTGASKIANASGIADVDSDGNDDSWSTDNDGIITWYMLTAYPYTFLDYFTNLSFIVPGLSILAYDRGTGATVASGLSGIADVDGDGNLERWFTDENGIVTTALYILYPYFYFGYFSDSSTLVNGETILYLQETGVGGPAINLSGANDIDEDGNNEQWTTNESGLLTWYTISAYPYEHLGYYSSSQTLINNSSVLRNGFGTGAAAVSGVSGIYDFDVDGNNEQWSTNDFGIINWYTISAYPFRHFGYYSDDAVLISGQSKLWNGFGTGATVVANVSGIDLVDSNVFMDQWSTDEQGVITWSEIPVIGAYWYSTQTTSWYDLSNWKLDSGLISAVNSLPISSTDVVIVSGGLIPYVDLDDLRWNQPNSINATGIGITFYSNASAAITCRLSGDPITFSGSSTFGI